MIEENTERSIPALSIVGLTKSYGKQVVVKDLDITVQRGEIFGFIGRNGTGKSTTIGCMVGLKPFREGRILIDGKDIRLDAVNAKLQIGYAPSEPACYEMMTGREFLSFTASAFRMKSKEFSERVDTLSEMFEFVSYDLDRKIGQYSLGMKQKISLMASLIHDPLLWVLDEPTIGLDAPATRTLAEVIKSRKKIGKSVFITSHSIEFVGTICDRVAILKDMGIARVVDLKGGETFDDLQEAYDTICLGKREPER